MICTLIEFNCTKIKFNFIKLNAPRVCIFKLELHADTVYSRQWPSNLI